MDLLETGVAINSLIILPSYRGNIARYINGTKKEDKKIANVIFIYIYIYLLTRFCLWHFLWMVEI